MIHPMLFDGLKHYSREAMNEGIEDCVFCDDERHYQFWKEWCTNFFHCHKWAFQRSALPLQLRYNIARWFRENHEGKIKEIYEPLCQALEMNSPEDVNPEIFNEKA